MIHCNSYKASMRAEHFLYFNKVMNFMHSHDSYPMIQLLLKSAHDPDYSALFGHRIFSFFTNERKFSVKYEAFPSFAWFLGKDKICEIWLSLSSSCHHDNSYVIRKPAFFATMYESTQ